jgi:pimeloyl-ACP methyl ester carboxylesterase
VSPEHAAQAAQALPLGQFLAIPQCGHAPQLEKPWLINRLVVHFLTSPRPTSSPRLSELLMARPSKVS